MAVNRNGTYFTVGKGLCWTRMAPDPSTRSGSPDDAGSGNGPCRPAEVDADQEAFDRLLDALGTDRDAAGTRYLEIRRNLVRLFEWRGCPTPDEYADETINRCARKIGEGEEIRDVATYCIGIARMLVREMGRDRSQQARPLEDAPEPRVQPAELEIDPDRPGPVPATLPRTSFRRKPATSFCTTIRETRGTRSGTARASPNCSAFRRAPCE